MPTATRLPASDPILAVTMLHGPANGRQVTFTHGPVTFGRETDNAIPVQASYASRYHGTMQLEKGCWFLEVISPNGCQVNGKTLAEKKRRRLVGGEAVSVGDQPLFRLDILAPAADASGSGAASPTTASTKPSLSKKTKLLVILGIWWLAVLSLFIFMSMNDQPGYTGDHSPIAEELTAKQIADAILQPKAKQPPNEAMAARLLRQANEQGVATAASAANLFKTYDQYQQALSYLPGDAFPDALDNLRYKDVQTKLIDEVTTRYNRAYTRLRKNSPVEAARDFTSLMGYYNDPSSLVYQNALAHAKAANDRIPQKKSFR